MTVEFVGMIGTQDASETRRAHRAADRPRLRRRFARAHEDAGFDRVLIGYGSATPDGTQVAAYAAAHTERLGLLIAHRPGFVAPTLAARTFATLDQFTGGPGRRAHHHRRQRRRAAPRRRLPGQGRAVRPHRRVPGHPAPRLDVAGAVLPRGPVLPLRGLRPRVRRSPRTGSRSTSAAPRRRPTGSAAGTPTSSRSGASRWRRPPSRSPRSRRRPPRPGARPAGHQRLVPADPRPRPRSWPGRAPSASSATIEAERRRHGVLHRRQGPACWAAASRENVGSQRLLAAAAKGDRHDRALWTAPRPGRRRGRQLHRAGRHARDRRPGPARLRRPRRHHHPDPRLRPARRRDRLRPAPDPAGTPGARPPGLGPCPGLRSGPRLRRRRHRGGAR